MVPISALLLNLSHPIRSVLTVDLRFGIFNLTINVPTSSVSSNSRFTVRNPGEHGSPPAFAIVYVLLPAPKNSTVEAVVI